MLEHLKLEWNDREDRFFDYWDVRTFPVNDVTRIQTGQTAGAARSQSAWEFLLLLRIIGSLANDQGLEEPISFTSLAKNFAGLASSVLTIKPRWQNGPNGKLKSISRFFRWVPPVRKNERRPPRDQRSPPTGNLYNSNPQSAHCGAGRARLLLLRGRG